MAARERRIEGKVARNDLRISIGENYEGSISPLRSNISRFSGGTVSSFADPIGRSRVQPPARGSTVQPVSYSPIAAPRVQLLTTRLPSRLTVLENRLCLPKISKYLKRQQLSLLHNSHRCLFSSRHASQLCPRSFVRGPLWRLRPWHSAAKSACCKGALQNASLVVSGQDQRRKSWLFGWVRITPARSSNALSTRLRCSDISALISRRWSRDHESA
jgi:hypothetical protein